MTANKTVHPLAEHKTEVNRRFERGRRDNPDKYSPPFDFDAIPMWVTAYFNDRMWLVAEKSDRVSSVEGMHIDLGALDRGEPGRAILHETWVNYFLSERKRLHFNWWESSDYR